MIQDLDNFFDSKPLQICLFSMRNQPHILVVKSSLNLFESKMLHPHDYDTFLVLVSVL